MTAERWEWIPGYEGYYQISNRGRVLSVHRVIQRNDGTDQTINGRVLKPARHRSGRYSILLCRGGRYERFWPHLLVPQLFGETESEIPA